MKSEAPLKASSLDGDEGEMARRREETTAWLRSRLVERKASQEDEGLRFTEIGRLIPVEPRETAEGYDGLRLLAKVDGSDRIGHHAYDPRGACCTIRTDGDGPGKATGLYITLRVLRHCGGRQTFLRCFQRKVRPTLANEETVDCCDGMCSAPSVC